jgi:hypothetical protein
LALEVIDGGDRAVVCGRVRLCRRDSKIEVEQPFFPALRLHPAGKALWLGALGAGQASHLIPSARAATKPAVF